MEVDFFAAIIIAFFAGMVVGKCITLIDEDYRKSVPAYVHKHEILVLCNILDNVTELAESVPENNQDLSHGIWIMAARKEIKHIHARYGKEII